jgi:arginine decarboxylase
LDPSAKTITNGSWDIEDSLDLYQVPAWGKPYFSINTAGHVVVRPDGTSEREIDLLEVVEGLHARDLTTPVVVRFSDILSHRLARLQKAFAHAIAENDYKNRYCAVFPIKVNQQRLVVEEVYRYGKEFGFGLEAGSKPELLAVMALTEDAPERIIVCNGFKDDSYIEAVILATKLGRTIIPVIENFEELALVLKHSAKYQVRPRIGVRVKLASEGAGRLRDSAGEKSKFGLFVTEILDLVKTLRAHDMLDCLELVHCHPGSQLQDIRRVKDAINELAHVYAELKLMGAGLKYIDVGGGLGVDYDGSGTNFESSMNYTMNEYANPAARRPRITACWCSMRSARRRWTNSGYRAASRMNTRATRSCRSRCSICSKPIARFPSDDWSSAITTPCRRANRRCRCSISACSAWSSAG